MKESTKQVIEQTSKQLFAASGYEGFTIRKLAEKTGIGQSSIYHFFADKDVLLEELFYSTNKHLGQERAKLRKRTSASDLLKDRINFQFAHIEDVVYVLKYYLHFRSRFHKQSSGYLPNKAYLHIEEVLQKGIETGEFKFDHSEIAEESKVVAHAINGFLLEYYPEKPSGSEQKRVVNSIHKFLMRSLTNKEVKM